jgi:hypothetical protein
MQRDLGLNGMVREARYCEAVQLLIMDLLGKWGEYSWQVAQMTEQSDSEAPSSPGKDSLTTGAVICHVCSKPMVLMQTEVPGRAGPLTGWICQFKHDEPSTEATLKEAPEERDGDYRVDSKTLPNCHAHGTLFWNNLVHASNDYASDDILDKCVCRDVDMNDCLYCKLWDIRNTGFLAGVEWLLAQWSQFAVTDALVDEAVRTWKITEEWGSLVHRSSTSTRERLKEVICAVLTAREGRQHVKSVYRAIPEEYQSFNCCYGDALARHCDAEAVLTSKTTLVEICGDAWCKRHVPGPNDSEMQCPTRTELPQKCAEKRDTAKETELLRIEKGSRTVFFDDLDRNNPPIKMKSRGARRDITCCPGCNPRGCHCQECFCRFEHACSNRPSAIKTETNAMIYDDLRPHIERSQGLLDL